MNKKKEEKDLEKEKCNCENDCECEKECKCEDTCECEECSCDETNEVSQEYEQKATYEQKAAEYLEMAKRVQADFDNFRKRSSEAIESAKIDGEVSILEVFLPCLDTFETAKKMITDQKVLEGVQMIEDKIRVNLQTIGVEEIPAVGEKFDPHMHSVIAVVNCADKEDGVVTEQFQAGYKFKDKIIRYSKVVVNKRED